MDGGDYVLGAIEAIVIALPAARDLLHVLLVVLIVDRRVPLQLLEKLIGLQPLILRLNLRVLLNILFNREDLFLFSVLEGAPPLGLEDRSIEPLVAGFVVIEDWVVVVGKELFGYPVAVLVLAGDWLDLVYSELLGRLDAVNLLLGMNLLDLSDVGPRLVHREGRVFLAGELLLWDFVLLRMRTL